MKRHKQNLPSINNRLNVKVAGANEKLPSISNSIEKDAGNLENYKNRLLKNLKVNPQLIDLPKLPVLKKNASPYRNRNKVYKNIRLDPIRY